MMLVQGSINARIHCGSYHVQNIEMIDHGMYKYHVCYYDEEWVIKWQGYVNHERSKPWYVLLAIVTAAHARANGIAYELP